MGSTATTTTAHVRTMSVDEMAGAGVRGRGVTVVAARPANGVATV
jgi:hypothetical protein